MVLVNALKDLLINLGVKAAFSPVLIVSLHFLYI